MIHNGPKIFLYVSLDSRLKAKASYCRFLYCQRSLKATDLVDWYSQIGLHNQDQKRWLTKEPRVGQGTLGVWGFESESPGRRRREHSTSSSLTKTGVCEDLSVTRLAQEGGEQPEGMVVTDRLNLKQYLSQQRQNALFYLQKTKKESAGIRQMQPQDGKHALRDSAAPGPPCRLTQKARPATPVGGKLWFPRKLKRMGEQWCQSPMETEVNRW